MFIIQIFYCEHKIFLLFLLNIQNDPFDISHSLLHTTFLSVFFFFFLNNFKLLQNNIFSKIYIFPFFKTVYSYE